MAFLDYEYKMKISYSEPVDKCYFTIKAVPTDDFRQRNITYDIEMIPSTTFSESKDSFGNTQLIGCDNVPHSVFEFKIKGLVETHDLNISCGLEENRVGMYRHPHGKCIPGDCIKSFAEELKQEISDGDSEIQKCKKIMARLYEAMRYIPGSTVVETTAEEAFSKGEGVCQDYSHILICLLRMFHIPARYVCGLIVGEGQSHAWVEAACDGSYIAFDPTHNREITDEYIKLGVGRDALDCAINRGVMWGGGLQTQDIQVTVRKVH